MAASATASKAKGSKSGAKRRKLSKHLCERLGIAQPIFGFSHSVEVTAALAKADCYPFIGLSQATPEEIPETLARVRDLVGDRPFGVDLLMPLSITGEPLIYTFAGQSVAWFNEQRTVAAIVEQLMNEAHDALGVLAGRT
jgi:hypothetical protein